MHSTVIFLSLASHEIGSPALYWALAIGDSVRLTWALFSLALYIGQLANQHPLRPNLAGCVGSCPEVCSCLGCRHPPFEKQLAIISLSYLATRLLSKLNACPLEVL